MEPKREHPPNDPNTPGSPSDAQTPGGGSGPSATPPPPTTPPPSARTPATAPATPASSTAGKPDTAKRFLGLFIDGIIAAILYGIVSVVVGAIVPGLWTSIWIGALAGGLVAGAYILVRDGLNVDFMRGRSLGKKLLKLDVQRLDGRPMDIETSVKRNWPLAIGYLGAVPVVGWILGLASLGLVVYEIYKVLTDEQGRRWGDELAGTKVLEVAN